MKTRLLIAALVMASWGVSPANAGLFEWCLAKVVIPTVAKATSPIVTAAGSSGASVSVAGVALPTTVFVLIVGHEIRLGTACVRHIEDAKLWRKWCPLTKKKRTRRLPANTVRVYG